MSILAGIERQFGFRSPPVDSPDELFSSYPGLQEALVSGVCERHFHSSFEPVFQLHRGLTGNRRAWTTLVSVIDGDTVSLPFYIVKPVHHPQEIKASLRAEAIGFGPPLVFVDRGQRIIAEDYYPNSSIEELFPSLSLAQRINYAHDLAHKIHAMFTLSDGQAIVYADRFNHHLRVVDTGYDVEAKLIDWGKTHTVSSYNRLSNMLDVMNALFNVRHILGSDIVGEVLHELSLQYQIASGEDRQFFSKVSESITSRFGLHIGL